VQGGKDVKTEDLKEERGDPARPISSMMREKTGLAGDKREVKIPKEKKKAMPR